MALTTGAKLGPYEVLSAVGAGGMGEVYKARDTRLDRTVAIKVLPSHLNSNPELRVRFEREAKAISGLQHPHICVLYDVGSQNGVDFLVMEYLEGETLYSRLSRKPLSTDEALKIAIEIADALEKAHRSGIIHRDLKPGNVMLTKTGSKLMDFGLAKPNALSSAGPASGVPSISSMATMAATVADLASPVTVAGTLIGTVQYMSPEQIQGKEADARSDIFAFGATLYEMLSGKRAFEGKSQLSLASAILERDPEPISTVIPLAPPALDQIVRTCLAKEPDDRFQSAHDLRLHLQWIAAGGSQVSAPAIVSTKRKKSAVALTTAMIAGWVSAIAAVALLLIYSSRLTTAEQPIHANMQMPAGFEFAPAAAGAPALSPDGQQIAIVGVKKNAPFLTPDSTIFLRRVGSGEAQPLPGTEHATYPFWSPDGRYLAFFADAKLKKIPIAGGPAQTICDVPDGRGGSWNEQGTIIFAPRIEGPLQSVSDGGGTPADVTRISKEESSFTDRNPYFLPDGKHFLYVHRGKDALGSVLAGSLSGGEPKDILPSGSNVAFSDGYLFYVKESALIAQSFDPSSLSFKGKPVSIAANLEFYPARNMGFFAVSRNVLVYHTAVTENRDLAWYDLSGKELEHWGDPGPYLGGAFSVPSQAISLLRADPTSTGYSDWLADVQRKTINRITPDSNAAQTARLSPDGKDLWIATTTGYLSSLSRKSLTASGAEEKLVDNFGGNLVITDVSRDGRYLIFNHQDPKTDYDVYMMDLKGERKLVPVLNSPASERDAQFSPDGKWISYRSRETGNEELFVTAFPTPGSRWQVSDGGATFGVWSADGKNLRYAQGDKIFNVEVHNDGGKLEFSLPKELVTLPPNLIPISILPDDKRILALRPTGDTVAVPMDFILNWQQLVR